MLIRIVNTSKLTSSDIESLSVHIEKNMLKKISRKHMIQDQINSIAGVGFTKKLLSQKFHISEGKIIFSTNAYGKPQANFPEMNFNWSHSGSFVAIIISEKSAVGVDVEQIKVIKHNIDDFVKNQFPLIENQYYDGEPDSKKLEVFYRLWVSNEAFLKQMGIGLLYGMEFFDLYIMKKYSCIIRTKSGIAMPIWWNELSSNNERLSVAACGFDMNERVTLLVCDGHDLLRSIK
ncbi:MULTISPECIES: 4'-phosphopantetheinyl transferase family protein [Lactobacillaceae]|uniref:4'-phosphopantetheinyl transferase ffp n=1 Tax=Levilactobacillus brevis KB290 TaxID=1001583 RepID=M5AI93_LEVBR|nr:4'-phosphopantetheinyl transferase superfamily protein [Lactiplantibacillus plantarum]MBO2723359.1 4'-phosphopantetheinyl transferase superfamily protein [Lactiplantibacillus plantarum]WND32790.1 4'-phosphopantetheinyl transferase superfamily protein [Lactiplantibacillus plantarum]BAN08115.1 4'-phosphopantetheinyl transferase ffp [Levilactobacillus brevis KB290]